MPAGASKRRGRSVPTQRSKPNENGVFDAVCREVIARRGRACASIALALCHDELYRYGVEMQSALGGFATPISIQSHGYPTLEAARTGALERLLRSWHAPFPSDPESVRAELADMHEQIEARLKQPSLF